MLESDYPYTSGAAGDDSTQSLYSHHKATSVIVDSCNYDIIQ